MKWDTSSSVAAYAKKMASSAWGGGIEMAVVSKMKGVNVHVYEASRDGYRRISAFDHESQPETRPVIRVLYGGGVHYGAYLRPHIHVYCMYDSTYFYQIVYRRACGSIVQNHLDFYIGALEYIPVFVLLLFLMKIL